MENVWQLAMMFFGGSASAALIGQLFNRKKLRHDIAAAQIEAALGLEERAMERYQSAADALDAAQRALAVATAAQAVAQEELKAQARYITYLHELLDRAGITYETFHRRTTDPAPRHVESLEE